MIPPAIAKALRLPALDDAAFQPTQWASAAEKAAFGNGLLRFLGEDCPREKFKKPFYRRLSQCFGMIAHYDITGFYSEYFETTADKIRFLENLVAWPCWGDPTYTFSDLERAVIARLAASGLREWLIRQSKSETETRERDMLARLKAKYEPRQDAFVEPANEKTCFLPVAQTSLPPAASRQASLFDLLS
ncbi:hypothetical protein [Beijerinckia mobilis]|uniref:hypothetical protein n=1 Tax=Beijerinckia mobilis TaxID=231434 RepID=UPI00068BF9BB|nr:hypothetical protein [Beijerinckia mobilis]